MTSHPWRPITNRPEVDNLPHKPWWLVGQISDLPASLPGKAQVFI
jgi:hypothetical protein